MSLKKQDCMVMTVWALIVVLFLPTGNLFGKSLTYAQIAERILETYKSDLKKLSNKDEQHFALRMYRMTGDTSWIPPIAKHLRSEIRIRQSDLDSISNSDYYNRRIEYLMSLLNPKTRRGKLRQALFAGRENIFLQLVQLHSLSTISDYSLNDSTVNNMTRRVISGLNIPMITTFICDSHTIKVYGTICINSVGYLKQLELADIINEYQKSFLEVFPDSADRDLDDKEFADKIYGLTHIIISASGYYQRILEREKYAWILDYFERNQIRIYKTLKPDIFSEIALCFLLTGDTANSMVDACRKEIASRFDEKAGMILSPSGKIDFKLGEHRNILAYMVLTWGGQLYPGPKLDYQKQVVKKKGD